MSEDEIKKKIEKLEKKIGEDNSCEYPEIALGKLYVFSVSEENRIAMLNPSQKILRQSPKFIYDSSSGNVHMFPKDDKIARLCADIIQQESKVEEKTGLRPAIKKEIENLIKSERYNDKNIKPRWGKGARNEFGNNTVIFNKIKKYKSFESLFFYLRVDCNNTRYDLCFNRFFIDKDNRVNCVLLSFQIVMSDIKKGPPLSIGYYPKNAEDGKGNEVYYNLGIDIHSSDKDIARKFLNFVVRRENKKANK